MTSFTGLPLHQQTYSLQHEALIDLLATTENLLIIQDLDGVCMGLVKDPLHRQIDPAYVEATQAFDGHFFVLTNGEHIGQRGVNGIVERAYANHPISYLPGLAAGGVQWQDRSGEVLHPGVSDEELSFLTAIPDRIQQRLRQFFSDRPTDLTPEQLEFCIEASALDNKASPTANLNTFYEALGNGHEIYIALQHEMQALMRELLAEAAQKGLSDSFFVHYAPNLGRDTSGTEIVWFSQGNESGTTDFQFMLRGAVKEAGVLAILNRYYHQRTGTYPLGAAFNSRQAPHDHQMLLQRVQENFDPATMPLIVGVGDTVTSKMVEENGELQAKRGGSDRNFLQLIQDINLHFGKGNLVVYIDSSGGELKNRQAIQVAAVNGKPEVVQGPCDPRDTTDPLKLNLVFPGGYQQYCAAFKTAAKRRQT
ncbi:glucosylglycerol 3-phosphatase [Almyronema epifaneia]|uniref:Glucosylglycerol 3-phosphatase n=1 Tax=Almyronema epifaneia S1 TaxID=2991925 RepID=A0ABW6IK20_9CYAN